jgi:signal transduction histidine kinase
MRPKTRRGHGDGHPGAAGGDGAKPPSGDAGQPSRRRAPLRAGLDAARHAIEARDRLVGVVGHDLRTPIAAIRASVALLFRRGDLAPEQARLVARIGASTVRMARIVRDLLDFSRLATEGSIPVALRPADVAAVVRGAVSELKSVYPDRDIVLEAPAPAIASVDPERLGQVVSNLVGNALEHGPRDAHVHVAVAVDDAGVAIRVHNRGPAIQGELSELFEPFRRGSSPGPGGAGLGLYIVREVLRAHGATVEVSSSDAGGTTFTVRLRAPSTTTGRPAP